MNGFVTQQRAQRFWHAVQRFGLTNGDLCPSWLRFLLPPCA
ncbi:hypothetical protein P3T43_006184 [Paraburkholderia sp. GAS41]